MSGGVDALLAAAMADPTMAWEVLGKVDAEEHLIDFIRLTWPVLEPATDFMDGWAVHAICEHLEAVTRGDIKRLLINVPPGCMKSLTTCVFWPAWEWGPRCLPHLRYVTASYSDVLSTRDNRKCRRLMQSDLYQRLWGDRFAFSGDQNAKTRYENDRSGYRIATSVGGVATGERGDRFIIDDPHNIKTAESDAVRGSTLQWFTEVVPTRINNPEKSAMVIIMQRVHEADVSGLILEKLADNYTHLCLPMEFEPDRKCVVEVTGFADPREEEDQLLWPERFSREYLEKELKPQLRSIGGTYAEAGQLQQRPAPRGGGMFKRDDFQRVDHVMGNVIMRVRGWDLAATKKGTAPYTTGVRMEMTQDGRLFITNVKRKQLEPGGVEELIRDTVKTDGPGVVQFFPQDPGQAGKVQKSAITRMLHGYDVHFSPESGDKTDRARPFAAQVEGGNVYLLPGAWVDEYLAEICTFPVGRFKDQTDATSRAYSRFVTVVVEDAGIFLPQEIR